MLKKIRKNIRSQVPSKQAIFTSIRKLTHTSDFGRWGTTDGLSPDWDSRTQLIATMIPPGHSVLEFGAGRMVLKECLHESSQYTPTDLVDRGHGTIICDLNGKTLPDFPRHHVAVFSGVLEYVIDIRRLVRHLLRSVDGIIASYAILELNPTKRRYYGWVNDYREGELVSIFEEEGFRMLRQEKWAMQGIYYFTNPDSALRVE